MNWSRYPRTTVAGLALTAIYLAALSTSVRTQGVALGNIIAAPVAPLGAVVVPDVNALGILDKTGASTADWPQITNAGHKQTLQQLGKALFWDMQVGGDGVQACATCHYHAGADNRAVNQLSPGLNAGDNVHDLLDGGPNAALTSPHFARGGLPVSEAALINAGAVADAANGAVGAPVKARSALDDVNDVVSSQGVRRGAFNGLSTGREDDHTLAEADDAVGGTSAVGGFNRDFGTNAAGVPDTVRRVEPRNSPTVLNAVYNFRNFWDGRADAFFNGRNPLGFRDPGARVQVFNGTDLVNERLRVPFSSLASQAVGPPVSSFEMRFANRTFADLGKKMTRPSTTPLDGQDVDPDDPLLGAIRNGGGEGLNVGYAALIRRVFHQRFWGHVNGDDVCLAFDGSLLGTAPADTCETALPDSEYTLLQWNFSLFFGLSVQAYEATLTTGNTIVDLINGGVATGVVSNGLAGKNLRTVNVGPAAGTTFGLSLDGCVAALSANLSGAARAAAAPACANYFARFITPGATTGAESGASPNPVPPGTAIGGCANPLTCARSRNQAAAVATIDNVSRGMGRFFAGATGCAICHFNPEFTGNSVSALTGFGAAPAEPLSPGQVRKIAPELPMERMLAFNGLATVYDSGFYNIGVRPSPEGLSLGDSIGGVPLAFSKLADAINGGARTGMDSRKIDAIAAELRANNIVQIPTSATNLAPRPFQLRLACGPGLNGSGGVAGDPNNNAGPACVPTVLPGERLLRNGAVHTQGLRNVKFTGPYFHNGAKMSLRQVVDFYKTAGQFTVLNLNNLDAGMRLFDLVPADAAALVEFMETGLTDWNVAFERGKFSHPQICLPNGHDSGTGRTVLVDVPATGRAGHADRLLTFEEQLNGASGGHSLGTPCTVSFTSPPR